MQVEFGKFLLADRGGVLNFKFDQVTGLDFFIIGTGRRPIPLLSGSGLLNNSITVSRAVFLQPPARVESSICNQVAHREICGSAHLEDDNRRHFQALLQCAVP